MKTKIIRWLLYLLIPVITSCSSIRHPFNKVKQQEHKKARDAEKVTKLKVKGSLELMDLFEKYPFLVDSLGSASIVIDTTIEGDSLGGEIQLNIPDSSDLENAVNFLDSVYNASNKTFIKDLDNPNQDNKQVIRDVLRRISWQVLLPEPMVVDTSGVIFTLLQKNDKLIYTIFVKPKLVSINTDVQQTQINTTSEIIYKSKAFYTYSEFWIAASAALILLLILLKRR